jgi:hypothetical protein
MQVLEAKDAFHALAIHQQRVHPGFLWAHSDLVHLKRISSPTFSAGLSVERDR